MSSPYNLILYCKLCFTGPENIGLLDFIKEGWHRVSSTENVEKDIRRSEFDAQKLYFTPLDEKMVSFQNSKFSNLYQIIFMIWYSLL